MRLSTLNIDTDEALALFFLPTSLEADEENDDEEDKVVLPASYSHVDNRFEPLPFKEAIKLLKELTVLLLLLLIFIGE